MVATRRSSTPYPKCYGSGYGSADNPCNGCSFALSCIREVDVELPPPPPLKADEEQAGGDHYKRMTVQPWNVIDTWPLAERIGFYRGNLLKYTMRMHDKDAPKDNIEKAAHYARKLAEVLNESR